MPARGMRRSWLTSKTNVKHSTANPTPRRDGGTWKGTGDLSVARTKNRHRRFFVIPTAWPPLFATSTYPDFHALIRRQVHLPSRLDGKSRVPRIELGFLMSTMVPEAAGAAGAAPPCNAGNVSHDNCVSARTRSAGLATAATRANSGFTGARPCVSMPVSSNRLA